MWDLAWCWFPGEKRKKKNDEVGRFAKEKNSWEFFPVVFGKFLYTLARAHFMDSF